MRAVFSLVLVVGIALAGFAVYMAKGYISDYQNALAAERAARAPAVPTQEVLIVTESVRYGQKITDENIRTVAWPQDAIPEGVFTSIDELFPQGEKRFRTVLRTMEASEAILQVKVTEPGHDAGVSARLTTGLRAFAIKVDASSGVSGFLAPGDYVDVYWIGRANMSGSLEGVSQDITKLIQTSLKIIAIDQSADMDATTPQVARTVTVEVSQEGAARLAQAQATGKLWLTLVPQGEAAGETQAGPIEIDQNDLLGIERAAEEAAPEAPKVCTIRERKGGETITREIACPQ
ncbi:MAG: Flp pilus assembly protein CpaB [Rhodobacterales bacterium]|nr:MAG: Flp pilus assembly protein CpaB [Rhodobacterales bacterium]